MKGTCAALLLLLAAALPARADDVARIDVPRIDVEAYCATPVAATLGGLRACRKAEATALGTLRANWNSYPQQRKHFCVQSVIFLRRDKRSYLDLAERLGESKVTS